MSDIMLNLIIKAVHIRLGRGEALEAILTSYTKLTDDERAFIRTAV